MKKINKRFCKTDNGYIFDIDTSSVLKETDIDITSDSFFIGKSLNHKILLESDYSDGSNLAINLNLTSACNMNCRYCFAQGGDYGKVHDNMDKNILPFLDKIIREKITSSKTVRFEYFGGEPLLNEEMIIELIEYAKILDKRGIRVIHRISTNLTSVSERMLNAICDNNFIVSVSIDGIKSVQDYQRPMKNNDSSYDRILQNIYRIKTRNPRIITVGRMTIAQKNIDLFKNICALVKTKLFNYISIYPATLINETEQTYFFDNNVKLQYEKILSNYNGILRLNKDFRGILEVERILEELLLGKLSISHCSAGGNYYTLSSDSSVVPCHRLCGNKSYFMNNSEDYLNNEIIAKWSQKVDNDPFCSECFARYICGGGCKQEHIVATGDFISKNEEACKYRKFFLESIISNIDVLARNFTKRHKSLDDMFVYCGRPIVNNNRDTILETIKEKYKIYKI